MIDIVDDENGCLRQQLHSPREDCAGGMPDAGELSSQVLIGIDGAPARPLRGAGRDDAVLVAAGERRDIAVELSLPASSTNETMTDRLDFVLRAIVADQTEDAVHGVSGAGGAPADEGPRGLFAPYADAVGQVADTVLPDTGSGVSLVLVALSVGSVGAGAVLLGRRRSRQP